MLFHLILKEISDLLKSFRFMLTSILVIVLMVLSAILFIPDYHQQLQDFDRSRNTTLAQLSEAASQEGALFNIFSWIVFINIGIDNKEAIGIP